MDAFITDSARKHGVPDDDIWSCYRHPHHERYDVEDDLWFSYGHDLAGNAMAVAFSERPDGVHVIVHALRGEIPPK